MDTEKFLYIDKEENDILNEVNYIDETCDCYSCIVEYIELTRNLLEIYQWYQIFKYELYEIKIIVGKDINDSILINAHTISLLSAGKNLMEEIDFCAKNTFGEESSNYSNFEKKYILKNTIIRFRIGF